MSSKPVIDDASIPSTVPPDNKVQAELTIKHTGPDPWFSDGSCTAGGGIIPSITGWKTPVKAYVDGQQVHEETYCIPNTDSRTVQVPFSVSEGGHEVKIEVYSIGGNAYLPGDLNKSVNDDIAQTVTGDPEADDPSGDSSLAELLNDIANQLGTSAATIAIGAVFVAGLFLVI